MARAFDKTKKIYIQDVTMRDGMHAIRHQYGIQHLVDICKALDATPGDMLEIIPDPPKPKRAKKTREK